MDLLFLLSILSLSASLACGAMQPRVGVCYGELGNNLPKPSESIKLIQNKLKAKRIKIYGTNPDIIKSTIDTDIQVSIMLPNQLIPNISANQTLADDWVRTNVLPFYPRSKIRYLLVGNEILSNQPNTTWFQLVPAMRRIRISVKKLGLKKVKIGTPLAMDCLESSYPPSNGTFRSSVRHQVIEPLLQFVNRTKSFFFVDVYTYFAWAGQPRQINLDYALLQPTNITVTDPGTGLKYTNLLDQMLDALYFAMNRTGYPNVRLFIAETGWPNGGDPDQIGANIYNAATYNRNVVKKLTRKPPPGTPFRPGQVIPAMIFALYNENNKTGPGTERHFGQMYPNGSFVYPIDLSGKTDKYPPLPKPEPPSYVGKLWCVVKSGANMTAVAAAQAWACSNGNSTHTCDAIGSGRPCSGGSAIDKASYAFSAYWSEMMSAGGSCVFDGVAESTKIDPSFKNCTFPSVYMGGF